MPPEVTHLGQTLGTLLTLAWLLPLAGFAIEIFGGFLWSRTSKTAAYLAVAVSATPVTWGCELFGPLLLAGDVVRQPVEYRDGKIVALEGPGLGVDIDPVMLKEWTRRG